MGPLIQEPLWQRLVGESEREDEKKKERYLMQ